MALNRSRSLLISQVYCSAIPMLNCSMQLHFIVTQRELSVIKVNASLWHRLPAHQDSELFLPKHISTTGIYGSPTLETKTLSFDGLREETECYEMSSVKSAWHLAKWTRSGTSDQQLSYPDHSVLPTKAGVKLGSPEALHRLRTRRKRHNHSKVGGFKQKKVGVG